jgi:tetratricopeptide (TPR) repeat protein
MSLGRGICALLLALLLALPARAADKVGVRAAEHDAQGFGRIAFDWPAPVSFEAAIDGKTLTVHFARPLDARFDVVASRLDAYVASIALSADHMTVTAELKKPATLHSFTDGNTVAIDIVAAAAAPPSRPAKAAATPPRQAAPAAAAATPAPAAPAAQATPAAQAVGVRFAEHPGYRRVVFDWKKAVRYDFAEKDGTARLHFSAPAKLDLARLKAALPDLSPALSDEEGGSVLTLAVPSGTGFRHFRSGDSIVLDVLGHRPQPAAAHRANGVVPPPELVEPSSGSSNEERRAPAGPPRPLTRPQSQAAPPGSLPVHFALAPQGASLRFDWPKPTAAAVFRRGPALWLVFAEPRRLDLGELRSGAGDVIARADQLPETKATVLRLVARPGLNPSLRRADNSWIVELKPQEVRADAPIPVEVHADAETPDLRFDLANAGEPLWLVDPELGDKLVVIPASEPGAGVAEEQDFVDLKALATVQGIALSPISDDLRVIDGKDGVQVTRPGGLVLSPGADRQLAQQPGGLGRLFDFASWRGPASETFLEKRSRLERAVAAAPASYRSRPRLALARFYFANLYAPEALGVLEAIDRDDPATAADPSVRLMQGAVHLMDDDVTDAAQELGQQSLSNEPEALLWRASLSAELGDWAVAAHGFALSSNLLSRYPKRLRNHFALQAAEAFLDTNQPAEAQAMTQLVLKGDPPPGDKGMALYLDGRRELAQGEYNKAIELWTDAAAIDDRPSRARALYARTLAELDAKKISRPEAVKQLDRLRFAWRGDMFEFSLLRKIGELKLADGDQQGAFDAMREAATDFPDYPQSKDVMKELSDAVANVFLGKGAEDVPPLKALTLYDEFKDYAPVGEQGDAIVRRLVDRLVSVDLLDRAAALLDDEVQHRLTGHDKARVAAQLALIRLLDNDPGGAIKALDIDVGKDVPSELVRQRQQLRARALAQLNRGDEALGILTNDTSRDADRLRADIYWRAQDWPEAAKVLARLVPAPPAEGALDSASGQLVLNWASALTLAGDQAGLEKLRQTYGKAMAASAYADAFRVVAGEPQTLAGGGDPRAIASRVAEVGELQSFMANYRERLAKDKLSAIN